jgi:hypothetical protein
MEEIKRTGTTVTASQMDCCQSVMEVKGRQVGMKSVLIVSGIFIFALLLLNNSGSSILGVLLFLRILACPFAL